MRHDIWTWARQKDQGLTFFLTKTLFTRVDFPLKGTRIFSSAGNLEKKFSYLLVRGRGAAVLIFETQPHQRMRWEEATAKFVAKQVVQHTAAFFLSHHLAFVSPWQSLVRAVLSSSSLLVCSFFRDNWVFDSRSILHSYRYPSLLPLSQPPTTWSPLLSTLVNGSSASLSAKKKTVKQGAKIKTYFLAVVDGRT